MTSENDDPIDGELVENMDTPIKNKDAAKQPSHVTKEPTNFAFVSRMRANRVDQAKKFIDSMRGYGEALIDLKKTEKQYEQIDRILEDVETRIIDDNERAKNTLAANRMHRDTNLAAAEIERIKMRQRLADVQAKSAKAGDENSEDHFQRKKEKVLEEARQKAELERELRELQEQQIESYEDEKAASIHRYVLRVERNYKRKIDLTNPDTWTEEDQEKLEAIVYKYDQLIENLQQ